MTCAYLFFIDLTGGNIQGVGSTGWFLDNQIISLLQQPRVTPNGDLPHAPSWQEGVRYWRVGVAGCVA